MCHAPTGRAPGSKASLWRRTQAGRAVAGSVPQKQGSRGARAAPYGAPRRRRRRGPRPRTLARPGWAGPGLGGERRGACLRTAGAGRIAVSFSGVASPPCCVCLPKKAVSLPARSSSSETHRALLCSHPRRPRPSALHRPSRSRPSADRQPRRAAAASSKARTAPNKERERDGTAFHGSAPADGRRVDSRPRSNTTPTTTTTRRHDDAKRRCCAPSNGVGAALTLTAPSTDGDFDRCRPAPAYHGAPSAFLTQRPANRSPPSIRSHE